MLTHPGGGGKWHPADTTMLEGVEQLTIVGPGLLGASVGKGLKARGFAGHVVGVARSAETLAAARQIGAIDEGLSDTAEAVSRASGTQVVVLAVPLGGFAAVMKQLAAVDRPGLVVTDVGSTKRSVIAAAQAAGLGMGRVVPAHPMAGSERSGPQHADGDLFVNRPCVLCPTAWTDEPSLSLVRALWAGLGANVLEMTADQHDQHVAAVSHLPHLLAVLLMNTVAQTGGLELASTGLASTSRLASSNPPMRADIIEHNADLIAQTLDRFAKELNALRGELRKGQRDAVLARLEAAQRLRDDWLK
jgi:prephenate dehydrogenase